MYASYRASGLRFSGWHTCSSTTAWSTAGSPSAPSRTCPTSGEWLPLTRYVRRAQRPLTPWGSTCQLGDFLRNFCADYVVVAPWQIHHMDKFEGVPYGLFLGPKVSARRMAPIVLSSRVLCCAVTTGQVTQYRTSTLIFLVNRPSQRASGCGECRSWRTLVASTSWSRSSPGSTGLGASEGLWTWRHTQPEEPYDLI